MIKKEIRYTDYNGVERMKTFYFNISMAEIIEMEADVEGGYGDFLRRIVETKDARNLVAEFKKLILRSVGIKSDDGERFIKNDTIRDEFVQTPAYESLFVELATDANAAASFITNVIPKEFSQQLASQTESMKTVAYESVAGTLPPPPSPDAPISH